MSLAKGEVQAMCCTYSAAKLQLDSLYSPIPFSWSAFQYCPTICEGSLLMRRQTGAQLPANAQCSFVSSCHEPMISCKVKFMLATEKEERSFYPVEISTKLIEIIIFPEKKAYWLCKVSNNHIGETDLWSTPWTDFPVPINTILCLVLIQ